MTHLHARKSNQSSLSGVGDNSSHCPKAIEARFHALAARSAVLKGRTIAIRGVALLLQLFMASTRKGRDKRQDETDMKQALESIPGKQTLVKLTKQSLSQASKPADDLDKLITVSCQVSRTHQRLIREAQQLSDATSQANWVRRIIMNAACDALGLEYADLSRYEGDLVAAEARKLGVSRRTLESQIAKAWVAAQRQSEPPPPAAPPKRKPKS